LPRNAAAPAAVLIEAMETRWLCSATLKFKDNKLTITGNDLPTEVAVFTSPTDQNLLQVTIDGVLVDPKINNGPPDGIKRTKVKKIWVTTGIGNDRIIVGVPGDVDSPSRGEHRIEARVFVSAGGGDDLIQGGPLNDVLIGGPGNDTIFGTDNNDLIFGCTGDDTISGNLRKDNIFGQDGNDTLNGDPGNDALYGLDGDDTLTGGPDADFLNGGAGNDTFLDGNNEPFAGARNDAQAYMNKLVKLAVPEKFRQAVFT